MVAAVAGNHAKVWQGASDFLEKWTYFTLIYLCTCGNLNWHLTKSMVEAALQQHVEL